MSTMILSPRASCRIKPFISRKYCSMFLTFSCKLIFLFQNALLSALKISLHLCNLLGRKFYCLSLSTA